MASIGSSIIPASSQLTSFGVANYSIVAANTEYAFVLPSGSKNFSFQTREGGLLQVASTMGDSNTTFFTIFPGCTYNISSVIGSNPVTLYVRSPKAAQTLEVFYWV
jgi:hypothetical protein